MVERTHSVAAPRAPIAGGGAPSEQLSGMLSPELAVRVFRRREALLRGGEAGEGVRVRGGEVGGGGGRGGEVGGRVRGASGDFAEHLAKPCSQLAYPCSVHSCCTVHRGHHRLVHPWRAWGYCHTVSPDRYSTSVLPLQLLASSTSSRESARRSAGQAPATHSLPRLPADPWGQMLSPGSLSNHLAILPRSRCSRRALITTTCAI